MQLALRKLLLMCGKQVGATEACTKAFICLGTLYENLLCNLNLFVIG